MQSSPAFFLDKMSIKHKKGFSPCKKECGMKHYRLQSRHRGVIHWMGMEENLDSNLDKEP